MYLYNNSSNTNTKIIAKLKNQKIYYYRLKNLKDLKRVLNELNKTSAKISKLFHKENIYYLVSEKKITDEDYNYNPYIKAKLMEYGNLICENAKETVLKLL